MSSGDLSEAVALYLGYGTHPYPRRDAGRVTARFGLFRGWTLSVKAKYLDRTVGKTSVDWSVDDLSTATEHARRRAAEVSPSLSDEALDALAWAFSYDRK